MNYASALAADMGWLMSSIPGDSWRSAVFRVSGASNFVVSSGDMLLAYDNFGHYQGQTSARVDINDFRQEPDPLKELGRLAEDIQTQIRAETLLKEVLGESRYKVFLQTKQITIPSKKSRDRYYVVREWGRVEVVDNGKVTEELCLVPKNTEVVSQDVMGLKKLLLENDEEAFLKIANHFPRYHKEEASGPRRRILELVGLR